MEKIKILFMGTPDFAVPVLQGLIEHYSVIGVVTQPDKKIGRHQELSFSPIKKVAMDASIPVFQPRNIREEYQELIDLNPDIIITCAYGQIIPSVILDVPRLGCINVHASLLPKLRGGAPIHKAIIDGYVKTGITIMYMDVKMDTGDIISQIETNITDEDTLETLHDCLCLMGRDLLLQTLPSIIQKTNSRISQVEEEATYAYNIKREEEYLDFTKNCRDLFNQIRGLSPAPGAYTIWNGQEMKVYGALISDRDICVSPGTITGLYKEGIGVSSGDGEIILTDIKPFGKKRMSAVSYINGLKNKDLIGQVLC